VFDRALNAITNVDEIYDFQDGVDKLYLDKGVFGKVANKGTAGLDASELQANAGGVALDSNDFILFDTSTGSLYYDADGSGAAGKVWFANLVGFSGTLDITDFTVGTPPAGP
jgi:hypothetical protein